MRGGFFIWPIVAASIIAAVLIIERAITLSVAQDGVEQLWLLTHDYLKKGDFTSARLALTKKKGSIAAYFIGLIFSRSFDAEMKETFLSQLQTNEIRRLETNMHIIDIIARITPLLGLLGTVTGMIKAFIVIQESGGVINPEVLAGGIWEAMITTAAGLIVAIPTLIAAGILTRRIDNCIADMEELHHRFALLLQTKSIETSDEI